MFRNKNVHTPVEGQKLVVRIDRTYGRLSPQTILATICADGTAIPPVIIYAAKSGNLQNNWLQDFDVKEHDCFFASSPSGWTNHELGFEYLTKIFNRHTKDKARCNWRLLFVDSHGSDLNMRFLNYCMERKIFVTVYPPQTTHHLQPLDVSLFAPLGIYYSQQLNEFMHQSKGLCRVSKCDFCRLF